MVWKRQEVDFLKMYFYLKHVALILPNICKISLVFIASHLPGSENREYSEPQTYN